eukprot:7659702-Lingulodinium_polyedra.AAC.1
MFSATSFFSRSSTICAQTLPTMASERRRLFARRLPATLRGAFARTVTNNLASAVSARGC